jgi:DNA-binding IclR family transcriptional regulator
MISVMQNAVQQPHSPARREGVQSIARAAELLRALGAHPQGLPLGELASAVGLAKSTVHRLVAALSEEELLSSGPDGRIVLGVGVSRLAAARLEALPMQLRPVLEKLRGELDETVDLAVLDGGEMRFVEQLPAAHRLRAVSSVGARFTLHCTANGKALLGAMGDARAAALLPKRLARATANTITSRAAIFEELEHVRREGVAFDREEYTAGVWAIGVAVLAGSEAVAAISVPVPIARFSGDEAHYLPAIRRAAREGARLLAS